MMNTAHFSSPLGDILLAADEAGLTGLWFAGSKYFAEGLDADAQPGSSPALQQACRWLTLYFSGRDPGFVPPLHPQGTAFQQLVWAQLLRIPYGQTTTYGALARDLAARLGRERFSAQAVGGAVGHNPISIIVPCHRVLGADGSLTGYAGGLARKQALLELEQKK